jgi:hypothetical protein
VFLKVGAHYLEESIVAIGTISRGDGTDTGSLQSEAQDGLKVGGAGPSFGVEAEVWRFGPVGVQFAADILVTFPLSGTDTQFELEEPGDEPPQCSVQPDAIPCVEPATFDFDADNIHYLGLASFRFAWLGY